MNHNRKHAGRLTVLWSGIAYTAVCGSFLVALAVLVLGKGAGA